MIKLVLLLGAGITIFLFGMLRLSAGIQKRFTARIRAYIRYAVRRPVWGLTTGIIATILFQSSSATTVIAVGMVSAGLISFYNSLAVILGADIGTTVIVQLVVWKIGDLSPLFIIAGGTVWALAKDRYKGAGESLFYFGLIFFGLNLVATATEPLRDNPEVIRFFRDSGHPFISFLFSAAFTGIVHASAIPISILVILGQQDLISLDNALPMVIGANVGTSVTALMASAVGDLGGKRTAVSHFLFKAVGALICLAALPIILPVIRGLSDQVAQQIALSHFLFNIFIVLVFFFFLRPFARMIEKLLPGQVETLPLWPEFLDDALLSKPEAALGGVEKELSREAALAQRIYDHAMALSEDYRAGKRRDILYIEMVINHLRDEIVQYLRRLSGQGLAEGFEKEIFAFTAVAGDIERMANHMVGFADLVRTRDAGKTAFTAAAIADLQTVGTLVGDNVADAAALITDGREAQHRISIIADREERIDRAVREARDRNLARFHDQQNSAESDPLFIEMLIHLERISDHCQNIGEYMDELQRSEPTRHTAPNADSSPAPDRSAE